MREFPGILFTVVVFFPIWLLLVAYAHLRYECRDCRFEYLKPYLWKWLYVLVLLGCPNTALIIAGAWDDARKSE